MSSPKQSTGEISDEKNNVVSHSPMACGKKEGGIKRRTITYGMLRTFFEGQPLNWQE